MPRDGVTMVPIVSTLDYLHSSPDRYLVSHLTGRSPAKTSCMKIRSGLKLSIGINSKNVFFFTWVFHRGKYNEYFYRENVRK